MTDLLHWQWLSETIGWPSELDYARPAWVRDCVWQM
jgi:hypothetical protein